MKRARKQKKAELMAKAEALIEQLLDWEEQNQRPTLTQIEEIVLKLRKQLGEEMAGMVLSDQEQNEPVPGPKCPQCGQEMRSKGRRGKQVQSRVGLVELERGYYTCPKCGEGIFPPRPTA